MTPAVSALHPSPMILQEYLLGMSPVWKVRGRCPEDVVIGLDLRRNEDSIGGRWKKCLVRENSVAGGHVDRASGAVEGLTRDQEGLGGGDKGDVVLGGVLGRWVLRKPPLVGGR